MLLKQRSQRGKASTNSAGLLNRKPRKALGRSYGKRSKGFRTHLSAICVERSRIRDASRKQPACVTHRKPYFQEQRQDSDAESIPEVQKYAGKTTMIFEAS